MKTRYLILPLAALAVLLSTGPAAAQEIMLDKFEKVGDLTCFQAFGNDKEWYYLPDKPRIAEKDGLPQFSFMKFVTTEETEGERGTTTAKGGGIVHFLVEFSVPENVVRRAEQELQRRHSGARIAGPIIYRSGTFALVSSVIDENNEYTSKIVGLGKAPIMEGHKAAVSILLTREGATLLWETFKTAAPDISLQFEMTVAGYREPFEAKLDGDWSLIAKNKTFAMGLKSTWVGLDIQNTMKELRRESAIKLTMKGSDEATERLVNMAYGKVVEYIFEKLDDPIANQTLADDPNLFSNFERAAQFNAAERARVNSENAAAAGGGVRTTRMGVRTPPSNYPAARRSAGGRTGSERGRGGQRPTSTTAARSGEQPSTSTGRRSGERDSGSGRGASRTGAGGTAERGGSGASGAGARRNPYNLSYNRQNPPSFSLLASYRVKRFKSSGEFHFYFNKYTLDNLVFPISENVGNLWERYGDDDRFFREVNLDDPVYKQRELIVFLDGQDVEDFGKYVNFVTVSLRKKHQSGDITTDELKIDRNNFQETGNNFRMVYGWKGDDDRAKWLNYHYKTHWSLFGGVEWESDWIETDSFGVNVVPPHRYRTIQLVADPDVLEDEGVRMVTVDFYYKLFGEQKHEKITIRVRPEDLDRVIEYAHEPNDFDYEYEIKWRKRGKTITSGRLKGSDDLIFCDELPEE